MSTQRLITDDQEISVMTPLRNAVAAQPSGLQQLLLGCGVIGPPLFIGTFLLAGANRPGYDAWRDAVSALGLGPGGWVQSANFIVFGLLIGAFALGLRRALVAGVGAIEAPLLQGVVALGLLCDGLFSHGSAHMLGDVLIFTARPLWCFVMARRFAWDLRWRGWAAYAVATGVLFWAFLIAFQMALAHGGPAGLFERLATIVGSLLTVALAARLLAGTGLAPRGAALMSGEAEGHGPAWRA